MKMSDWSSNMKLYLQYERNAENRNYIEALRKDNNVQQLERLFAGRLTFGTAGIRGQMGPGYTQMNDLVIIQTSQGLASYLLECKGERLCKEQGVIIGHDARHNSSRFSRLAALAFLQKGIPVYYCDHIIPTPLVAFGVRHFNCLAGIMVTASHNPKNDNGYKVYWSNGAQILSPHDKNIQSHIEKAENQQPWPRAWQHELLEIQPAGPTPSLTTTTALGTSPSRAPPTTTATKSIATTTTTTTTTGNLPMEWDEILFRIHADLSRSYFLFLEQLVGDRRQLNQASSICITYTSMHGVGHMFLSRALDIAGFEDTFAVEMQKRPDPEFSTVRFPNPEEEGALELAFQTAMHANSNLILANDPDADRCAAALYNPRTRYRRVLNGNEIGALLGWWIWYSYRNRPLTTSATATATATTSHAMRPLEQLSSTIEEMGSDESLRASLAVAPAPRSPKDCYMLSTAVSSKFLQSMAQKEGFQFVETLTGFKYMGNLADELINKQAKCVLFAYEEAIGYMVDAQILDKDGISAAVQLAQCAAHLASGHSRTLEQHLDWLYTRYGYHYNYNSYYICRDPQTIRTIFHRLQSNFPKTFEVTHDDSRRVFHVTRVRDLNIGFDSGTADHKPTLPVSTSSFMVTFFIKEHDITLTIRTSGTEPKIKFYSEIIVRDLPAWLEAAPASSTAQSAQSASDAGHMQRVAASQHERQRIKSEAQTTLRQFVEAAVERCLRPAHYKLEPAARPS